MTKDELADAYRAYIACLNARDWANLGRFVHEDASHNGRPFGLVGYRAMLEDDVRCIPDLRFNIALLVTDPPHVACRLAFDCSPRGEFLGLPVDGRRVRFDENVFYRFEAGRIVEVWSVIDRQAIAAQAIIGAPSRAQAKPKGMEAGPVSDQAFRPPRPADQGP